MSRPRRSRRVSPNSRPRRSIRAHAFANGAPLTQAAVRVNNKNGPLIGVPNRTPPGQVWEIKPGFMLVTTMG